MVSLAKNSSLEIPTADGVANAYLARPDERSHPGVLLITDAFGLRPTTKEMADRIAADGYVVLVPNVFYRAGHSPVPVLHDLAEPEQRARFTEEVWPLVEQLTPERITADGAAYLDYLENVASPGRVAITGYCMGGRLGWWISADQPGRVAALAMFHTGGLVTDDLDSPYRSAARLKDTELYFGFADQDPNMSAGQIDILERALDDAGAHYRAEVYEGARHGYTMADLAAYNEAARERHFRELHALLGRTLG